MPLALEYLLKKSKTWTEKIAPKIIQNAREMLNSENWEDRDSAVEALTVLLKYYSTDSKLPYVPYIRPFCRNIQK